MEDKKQVVIQFENRFTDERGETLKVTECLITDEETTIKDIASWVVRKTQSASSFCGECRLIMPDGYILARSFKAI